MPCNNVNVITYDLNVPEGRNGLMIMCGIFIVDNFLWRAGHIGHFICG